MNQENFNFNGDNNPPYLHPSQNYPNNSNQVFPFNQPSNLNQQNVIPMQYHQQQHYINYSPNDPFSNPYFNDVGQTYQDNTKNPTSINNYTQNVSFNGLKDHDVNLNYNKFMVFFQYDSVNIFAFDFKKRIWLKCPNYYNFKMLSYFRVVQTPEFGFILTGGSYSDDNFSNNTYYYNDGYFMKKQGMKTKRRAHSSIYHEGFVYVFGGLTTNGGTELCERYNIEKDEWQSIQSLSKVRTLSSCCLFGKDWIYIMGGYNEKTDTDLLNIECFNVRTLSFSEAICQMPLTLENTVVAQINESEIIIMGGYNLSQNKDNDEIHVVNVINGKSSFKGKMNQGFWTVLSNPILINANTFMVFFTGEGDFTPEFMEVSIYN